MRQLMSTFQLSLNRGVKDSQESEERGQPSKNLDIMRADVTLFKTGGCDPVGVSSEDKKSSRKLTGL